MLVPSDPKYVPLSLQSVTTTTDIMMAFIATSAVVTASHAYPACSVQTRLHTTAQGQFASIGNHKSRLQIRRPRTWPGQATQSRVIKDAAITMSEEGGSKPPIDAPSSILLLSSSVMAIASVGSVFELTGGKPMYGATVTSVILTVALPSFLFLFYAAIRKGQQEALDDP